MAHLRTQHGPIYYHVRGEGPALLLLHGLSRSSRYWIGFDRRLAKHFKVITMDARGVGRTKVPSQWGHTTADLADDAAALLDHLKIKKAHIFGLSLGGMVALTLGLRHPRRVLSLVVVNTSVAGTGHPRLLPQALLAMSLGVVLRPLKHSLLLKVCVGGQHPATKRRRISEQWRKIEAKERVRYLTALKQVVTALRFRTLGDLPQLQIPVLVVCGSEDNFVSQGNSRALAEILPQAQFCCLEGAGHEITIERPKELASHIVNFVQSLKRQ